MPELLDTFEFKRQGNSESKYARYLDGSVWRLKVPDDLPHVERGRAYLTRIATRRGLKIRTHSEPNALVIQAYKPTPNENVDS